MSRAARANHQRDDTLLSEATSSQLFALQVANDLAKHGQIEHATDLLSAVLTDALYAASPRMTSRIVMRLASLYRMLGQYADEVQLLERFTRLAPDDYQRSRADALISKAEASLMRARAVGAIPINLRKPRAQRMGKLERRLGRIARAERVAAGLR